MDENIHSRLMLGVLVKNNLDMDFISVFKFADGSREGLSEGIVGVEKAFSIASFDGEKVSNPTTDQRAKYSEASCEENCNITAYVYDLLLAALFGHIISLSIIVLSLWLFMYSVAANVLFYT